MEASEPRLSQFLRTYGAKNIFKDKTYFKGKTKASCIGVLIANNPLSFQNTRAIATGLLAFHMMLLENNI